MKIAGRTISLRNKPYIIAELSANHNGSLQKALKCVSLAAEAGADAIKLQTYRADSITLNLRRGEFLDKNKKSLWFGKSLHSIYKKGETPWNWHEKIFKLAGKKITSDTIHLHFSVNHTTRVSAVLPPMSVNGPTFNLLKIPSTKISWTDLINWKAVTTEASELIQKIIKDDKTILIGGSVGSGKTTLANLCANTIDENYRVVTLEKVANLILDRKRLARLEAPNNEKIEMVDLVKVASHMRADYLVLNEFEGPEAMSFIELLRDGHSGMGVIGASNIFDCLKRLELKALGSNIGGTVDNVRYAISEAFDYVIFQDRLPSGKRVITGIGEVKYDNGELKCEIVYKFKDAE